MIRKPHRMRDGEQGQAIVLVALFMVGMVAVVGLVGDGGMVFAQRRDLQNAADAAALAGAMQIDETVYRESSGGSVVLDASAARRATLEFLAEEGDLEYSVDVSPDRVEVAVAREAKTGFLRVIGFNSVEITSQAHAEPRYGVSSGGS